MQGREDTTELLGDNLVNAKMYFFFLTSLLFLNLAQVPGSLCGSLLSEASSLSRLRRYDFAHRASNA